MSQSPRKLNITLVNSEKHRPRLTRFDKDIILLLRPPLSRREFQQHLEEIYRLGASEHLELFETQS